MEQARLKKRRGGRAVECVGLENRYTRKGIKGSNPFLSAKVFIRIDQVWMRLHYMLVVGWMV